MHELAAMQRRDACRCGSQHAEEHIAAVITTKACSAQDKLLDFSCSDYAKQSRTLGTADVWKP